MSRSMAERIGLNNSVKASAVDECTDEVGSVLDTSYFDKQENEYYGYMLCSAASGHDKYVFGVLGNKATYMEQIGRFRTAVTVISIASCLVSFVVLYYLSHWQTRPLMRLAREVGKLDVREPVMIANGNDGPREAIILRGTINRFIDSLMELRERERSNILQIEEALKTAKADIEQKEMRHQGFTHTIKQLLGSILAIKFGGMTDEEKTAFEETSNSIQRLLTTKLDIFVAETLNEVVQPTDLWKSVERFEAVMRIKYSEIEFESAARDGDVSVRVRNEHLLTMLGNLLHNAGEHAERHVRIRVKVRCELATVIIENDGDAFPLEGRERLKEWGVRASNKPGGQGIGLGHVNALAKSYGGSLKLGDSELGGARVKLELPINALNRGIEG